MGFTDTTIMWRLAFFISIIAFVMLLAAVASSYMAYTELIPTMWILIGFLCNNASCSRRELQWRPLATQPFVITLASVASTYMASVELIPNMWMHIGLWDICDDTRSFSCQTVDEFLIIADDDNDWVLGARAMSVIGLILHGLIPLISLYLIYAVSTDQLACLIIGSVDLTAAIFCTVGGIIFIVYGLDLLERTVEMYAQPSWSFVLLMIGQFLTLSSSAINYYEACRDHSG